MKISANVLRRFCTGAPTQPKELRKLLDDLGIEVKRLDAQGSDAHLTLELLANRGEDRGPYEPVEQKQSAAVVGVHRSDDLTRDPVWPVVRSDALEHGLVPGVIDSVECAVRVRNQRVRVDVACRSGR